MRPGMSTVARWRRPRQTAFAAAPLTYLFPRAASGLREVRAPGRKGAPGCPQPVHKSEGFCAGHERLGSGVSRGGARQLRCNPPTSCRARCHTHAIRLRYTCHTFAIRKAYALQTPYSWGEKAQFSAGCAWPGFSAGSFDACPAAEQPPKCCRRIHSKHAANAPTPPHPNIKWKTPRAEAQ